MAQYEIDILYALYISGSITVFLFYVTIFSKGFWPLDIV